MKRSFGDTPYMPEATIQRTNADKGPLVRSVRKISSLAGPHTASQTPVSIEASMEPSTFLLDWQLFDM